MKKDFSSLYSIAQLHNIVAWEKMGVKGEVLPPKYPLQACAEDGISDLMSHSLCYMTNLTLLKNLRPNLNGCTDSFIPMEGSPEPA